MQISTLKITKLFGLYNYTLKFNPEISSLALITGPNGYGKTTILKIIGCLNQEELYFYYTLKFEDIEFSFDDGSSLSISQKNVAPEEDTLFEDNYDLSYPSVKEVSFSWIKNGTKIASFIYNQISIDKAIKYLRYDYFEFHKTISKNAKDRDTLLSKCAPLNEYIAHAQNQERFLLQLQTIRTKFISANRIYNEFQTENEKIPIIRVSANLQKILETSRVDYLSYSQSEDGVFIREILSLGEQQISIDQYEDLIKELKIQAEKLQSYGFTDNRIELPDYSPETNRILALYIAHLSNKLHHCDSVLNKISLFEEMLKSKKFSNKTITFSTQHGILAKAVNGEFIELTNLSSGEQNEIVLLYNLIFEVPDRSILLVDEPENSLHVTWQKMIVADFEQIAQRKDLQLIVATHSPSIVSQGKRVATDLFYLTKNKDGE